MADWMRQKNNLQWFFDGLLVEKCPRYFKSICLPLEMLG